MLNDCSVFLMKHLHRCIEARLQCSNSTLCYRLRRLMEGYKTLGNPFHFSAAENSYAGERSHMVNNYFLVFNEIYLHRCIEARLQCSNSTLCYRLRRLMEGYKTRKKHPNVTLDCLSAQITHACRRTAAV